VDKELGAEPMMPGSEDIKCNQNSG